MKKNGFTLVELLASITILAIIASIATYTIVKFSDSIKGKNKENIIKRIEVAASKYAYETGSTAVLVDDLIKSGYLTGDNNSDDILDPVSNVRMNCYAVAMEKNNNYYTAKFVDSKNYIDDNAENECDTRKFGEDYVSITVKVKQNGVIISPADVWINGIVTLEASSTSDLNCSTNTCKWTSTSGHESNGTGVTLNTNNIEYKTKYTFQYSDESSNQNLTTSVNLKIDKLAPRITNIVNNGDGTLTVSVLENGSGVKEMCINNSSDNVDDCTWENVSGLKFTNNTLISETGSYYVHVKDNADNVSHSDPIVVNISNE